MTDRINLRFDKFIRNSIKWLSALRYWSISDIFSSKCDGEKFNPFRQWKMDGIHGKYVWPGFLLDIAMDEFLGVKTLIANTVVLVDAGWDKRRKKSWRFSRRRQRWQCDSAQVFFFLLRTFRSITQFKFWINFCDRYTRIAFSAHSNENDFRWVWYKLWCRGPIAHILRLLSIGIPRHWNVNTELGCKWQKWLHWVHAWNQLKLESRNFGLTWLTWFRGITHPPYSL